MNGCRLSGIRGLYVWHVLAAPPWPQITPYSWQREAGLLLPIGSRDTA